MDFLTKHMRDPERLLAEWFDLGRRGVALRNTVIWQEGSFPRQALGYKVACTDALIRVSNDATSLIIALADWYNDLIDIRPEFRAERGFLTAVGFRDRPERLLVTDDAPRGAIIPRERWIAIGETWKHIRDESMTIHVAIGRLVRKSSRVLGAASRLDRSVLRARSHLDTMVCTQNPDWPDAIRVFFGGDAPRVDRLPRSEPPPPLDGANWPLGRPFFSEGYT